MNRKIRVLGKSLPLWLLLLLILVPTAIVVAQTVSWLLKLSYVTVTVVKPSPGVYVITATVECDEVTAGRDFDGFGHGRLSVVDVVAKTIVAPEYIYAEGIDSKELEALWYVRTKIYIENETHMFYGYLYVVESGNISNRFDGWYIVNKSEWETVGPVSEIELYPDVYDVYIHVYGEAGYPTETITVDYMVKLLMTQKEVGAL